MIAILILVLTGYLTVIVALAFVGIALDKVCKVCKVMN